MTLVEQYRMAPDCFRGKATYSGSKVVFTKWVLLGWIISFAGTALWLYGYFGYGSPPLIDWYSMVPLWIAQFFRNIECEAGVGCSLAGMLLISWPHL